MLGSGCRQRHCRPATKATAKASGQGMPACSAAEPRAALVVVELERAGAAVRLHVEVRDHTGDRRVEADDEVELDELARGVGLAQRLVLAAPPGEDHGHRLEQQAIRRGEAGDVAGGQRLDLQIGRAHV